MLTLAGLSLLPLLSTDVDNVLKIALVYGIGAGFTSLLLALSLSLVFKIEAFRLTDLPFPPIASLFDDLPLQRVSNNGSLTKVILSSIFTGSLFLNALNSPPPTQTSILMLLITRSVRANNH